MAFIQRQALCSELESLVKKGRLSCLTTILASKNTPPASLQSSTIVNDGDSVDGAEAPGSSGGGLTLETGNRATPSPARLARRSENFSTQTKAGHCSSTNPPLSIGQDEMDKVVKIIVSLIM